MDTPDQKQDGLANSGPSPHSKGNEDGHNSTSLRQEDEAGDEAVAEGQDEVGDEAVDEERVEAGEHESSEAVLSTLTATSSL